MAGEVEPPVAEFAKQVIPPADDPAGSEYGAVGTAFTDEAGHATQRAGSSHSFDCHRNWGARCSSRAVVLPIAELARVATPPAVHVARDEDGAEAEAVAGQADHATQGAGSAHPLDRHRSSGALISI